MRLKPALPMILVALLLVGARPLSAADAESNLNGLRADLSAVVQAIYYRITAVKTDSMGIVHFEADSIERVDDGLDYQGFALKRTILLKDLPVGDSAIHRRADGILQLSGGLGRVAHLSFAVDYLLADRTLLIQRLVIDDHFPTQAPSQMLIVPAARLPSLATLKRFHLQELHRLFAENALDPKQLA
ncbi:MAG: hypothetical protein ACPG4N_06075, partial [Gammaproteobacteria bacterium]